MSIRENLKNLSKKNNCIVVYPNQKFCGDNASMIAWAGIQRYKKNLIDNLDIVAKSRWPLDANAPYMKGTRFKIIMQYWLLKSEPDVWSINQQKKAGKKGAQWDGVRNYQARNNLKKMKIDDLCFFIIQTLVNKL